MVEEQPSDMEEKVEIIEDIAKPVEYESFNVVRKVCFVPRSFVDEHAEHSIVELYGEKYLAWKYYNLDEDPAQLVVFTISKMGEDDVVKFCEHVDRNPGIAVLDTISRGKEKDVVASLGNENGD